MESKKFFLWLSVFLFLFTGISQGFEIQGKLTRIWERNSFSLETRAEETVLWFEIPRNSRIRVKVSGGGEEEEFKFKIPQSVTLLGAKEWRITVLWDSGEVIWRSRLNRGEEPILKMVQGYADTLFTFNWSLSTEEDLEKWRWTSPLDATFIVRQISLTRRGAEEQELARMSQTELFGPGVFKIEVKPIVGGGEFTAERIK